VRRLVEHGADVDADPYRGTALTWAAVNGHAETVAALLGLGADPNGRGTFGGPTHGEGVTALHIAAQNGRDDAIRVLLEGGADATIADALHGGTPDGWADFGGHRQLARRLREA
jgi:ankyrin repeat protein